MTCHLSSARTPLRLDVDLFRPGHAGVGVVEPQRPRRVAALQEQAGREHHHAAAPDPAFDDIALKPGVECVRQHAGEGQDAIGPLHGVGAHRLTCAVKSRRSSVSVMHIPGAKQPGACTFDGAHGARGGDCKLSPGARARVNSRVRLIAQAAVRAWFDSDNPAALRPFQTAEALLKVAQQAGQGERVMSDQGSFDYIIVGAGSAGCVLANRHSADPKHRVLLLEAGGDDRPAAQSQAVHLQHADPYAHRVRQDAERPEGELALRDEVDEGSGGRKHKWPKGKVLGGSSSINGLLYIRGQAADYDGWRQMGCEGWGYDDVKPYFIRSEHQERGGDDFHGTGRAAEHLGHDRAAPDLRRPAGGGGRGGHPPLARHQRRAPGGRHLVPVHHQERPAPLPPPPWATCTR